RSRWRSAVRRPPPPWRQESVPARERRSRCRTPERSRGSCGVLLAFEHLSRYAACAPIGHHERLAVAAIAVAQPLEGGVDRARDVQEADPAIQEECHCLLVGRVED